MAIAYRCDTGTLIVNFVTGRQTITFPTTQPSAGDLVVAGGTMFGNGSTFTPTVDDDEGNGTYTNDIAKNSRASADGSKAVIASKANVAVSGSFTVGFATGISSSYYGCGAVAFSGAATSSALDVTATANTENADQSSQVTGTTATTAQADAVAVIALGIDNSNNIISITSTGFTVPVSSPDGTSNVVGGLGYKILSATGAQSATWTYGATSGAAADDHAAGIAVYKGAAAGGGATPPLSRRIYVLQ